MPKAKKPKAKNAIWSKPKRKAAAPNSAAKRNKKTSSYDDMMEALIAENAAAASELTENAAVTSDSSLDYTAENDALDTLRLFAIEEFMAQADATASNSTDAANSAASSASSSAPANNSSLAASNAADLSAESALRAQLLKESQQAMAQTVMALDKLCDGLFRHLQSLDSMTGVRFQELTKLAHTLQANMGGLSEGQDAIATSFSELITDTHNHVLALNEQVQEGEQAKATESAKVAAQAATINDLQQQVLRLQEAEQSRAADAANVAAQAATITDLQQQILQLKASQKSFQESMLRNYQQDWKINDGLIERRMVNIQEILLKETAEQLQQVQQAVSNNVLAGLGHAAAAAASTLVTDAANMANNHSVKSPPRRSVLSALQQNAFLGSRTVDCADMHTDAKTPLKAPPAAPSRAPGT